MHITTVTSESNAIFKMLQSIKERKGRDKFGLFFVEGQRFVYEAILRGAQIAYICMTEHFAAKEGNRWLAKHSEQLSSVLIVPEKLMKRLTDTVNDQGVCAAVKMNTQAAENIYTGMTAIGQNAGLWVICDRIQDPGNLGTIIRTSHAAGAKGLIMAKGCVDVYNTKTLRSTMGSIFCMDIYESANIAEDIRRLCESGFRVYGAALEGGCPYTEADMNAADGAVAIVIGNEGNGICDEVLAVCTRNIYIPMPGGAESLNASAAAAVLLYEFVRQNNSGQ